MIGMIGPTPEIDYKEVYRFLMATANAYGVQIPDGVAYTTNWTVTHSHHDRVEVEATVKLQTSRDAFNRACWEVKRDILTKATPEQRVALEEGFRKLEV